MDKRYLFGVLICIIILVAIIAWPKPNGNGEPNQPPVIDAGINKSGKVGDSINFLDATANDPDGDDLTYNWEFGDGNTVNEYRPNHIYNSPGTFIVTFEVSDGENKVTDTLNVTITLNKLPLAKFQVTPFQATIGTTFNVDATESYDPDGNITKYEWDWEGDGVYDDTGIESSYIYNIVGNFKIELRVTDSNGAYGFNWSTISVEKISNKYPIAIFEVTPLNSTVGSTFSVDATESYDPDGNITKYEWDWTNDGTYDDTGINANHIYNIVGKYTITLRVTDNEDATSTNSTKINVIKTQNIPPVAIFHIIPLSATIDTIFEVNATESYDTDGNITKYEWDWTSDGTYDDTGMKSSHIYSISGNYKITLRVTDNEGAIGINSTEISVLPKEIPPPADENVTVYYIDVGQGDSILIHTPEDKFILIDAGDKNAYTKVINFLNDKSIETIDVFIATHPDADHIGGADEVLESFEVLNIYHPGYEKTTTAYNEFITAAENENVPIYTDDDIDPGDFISIDTSITLQIMHIDKNAGNSNDATIVTRLDYDGVSFLFTGDISDSVESQIITDPNLDFNIDILKVAHHGSKYSTSNGFLDETTPEDGVISVGEGNSYGHPTTETLNRLLSHSVDVYRTDYHGTVTITSDGDTWDIYTEKNDIPVNNPPVADFSYAIDELTVTFTDQSTDADGDTLTYQWSFGDGESSSLKNPVHSYNSDGIYSVSLKVDDGTDFDTISKDVDVSSTPPPSGKIVINEVEANPEGTDSGNEWVELYNPSSNSVDIGGWKIKSTAGTTHTYNIPSGTTLNPGQYLVITFSSQFVDNNGEKLQLFDQSNNLKDETLTFSDTANDGRTWQRSPNGVDTDSDGDWTFKTGTKGSSN